MQKHRNITLERLDRFTTTGQFSDVNIQACLWSHKCSTLVETLPSSNDGYVHMASYAIPGPQSRPSYAEATSNLSLFKTIQKDHKFGPSWSTHWVLVQVKVPQSWKGKDVRFVWYTGCEGLVWDRHLPNPKQGLTDQRCDYQLTSCAQGREEISFFIEVACNGMFGNGDDGIIQPPVPDKYFTIQTVELAVPNHNAFALLHDFEIVSEMAKQLPEDSPRGVQALWVANAMINAFRYDEMSTLEAARKEAHEFLNESPAASKGHSITAIGHCHIDTAWLWSYDETRRKCARSWSSQFVLMDRFPEYKFVISQARQCKWVEQDYPSLHKEMKKRVQSGQLIPIGGSWVEMDANVPSGESFVRQFLYGQRYFERTFGQRCSVFWLPDTFGYSAQLPQLIKNAGMPYFFTQKLSWNNMNKFPHTTFHWEGLDGSRVLTHFSPADTYTAQANVRDNLFMTRNNKDKDRANSSLLVYGNGDGGGGPTEAMLERIVRMKNVDGLSKVSFGSPVDFYESLTKNESNLLKWKGELYFEFHRGTYTSQAKNKWYNRRCENQLRDVELLSVLAAVQNEKFKFPTEELDHCWENVLLNQFHDVLPGSSIEQVYEDSLTLYKQVESTLQQLQERALNALLGEGLKLSVVNTLSFDRSAVLEVDKKRIPFAPLQYTGNGEKALIWTDSVPAMSNVIIEKPATNSGPLSIKTNEKGHFILSNSYLTAVIDSKGHLLELKDGSLREFMSAPGNVFRYFEDVPLFWDAWDIEAYHLEKHWEAEPCKVSIYEQGPLRVALLFQGKLSATSSLKQMISLSLNSRTLQFDTEIDWQENRRCLKVEFPFAIHSHEAIYETQFGHLARPTHRNTSWDVARFEVCGHRFAVLQEFGAGVALLNNAKYGYSCLDQVMRLTLLRSPKAPDAHCDLGFHSFTYSLMPFTGVSSFKEAGVIEEASSLNSPMVIHFGLEKSWTSLFECQSTGIVLATVKWSSEQHQRAIIVRLYEAFGGRGVAQIKTRLPVSKVTFCNILEDDLQTLEKQNESDSWHVPFTPFQVLTLKFSS